MDKHRSARVAADALIRQYQLKKAALDNLVPIIGELGFQIIDYELDGYDYASTLISELGLSSIARKKRAFVYQKEDVNLLFVYDLLAPDEKLYAIAHELGHIKCGHLTNTGISTHEMSEEYEANEFAHYLLHPRLTTRFLSWTGRHKIAIAIASCILVIALVSVPITRHIMLERSYYGEYYVTENGEKYHIEGCISIRGRDGVRRLTEEEYNSGKYDACSICFPK